MLHRKVGLWLEVLGCYPRIPENIIIMSSEDDWWWLQMSTEVSDEGTRVGSSHWFDLMNKRPVCHISVHFFSVRLMSGNEGNATSMFYFHAPETRLWTTFRCWSTNLWYGVWPERAVSASQCVDAQYIDVCMHVTRRVFLRVTALSCIWMS